MSKRKNRRRRLTVGALAGLGATFANLAAFATADPGGIFAALSTLSWLGAIYVTARR